MIDPILQLFHQYWGRKVEAGQCSGFDRVEQLALEIYTKWLIENGHLYQAAHQPKMPELESEE